MNKLKPKPKRKLKRRRQPQDFVTDSSASDAAMSKRKTAQHAGGPVMQQGEMPEAEADEGHDTHQTAKVEDETAAKMGPAPSVEGTGPERHVTVHGNGGSLRLEGRTDANFDGGAFETKNVRVRRATTCENCLEGECSHVTGTLVANYHVNTTVTLPSVADFPDLSRCQQQRVRNAINTVLAPHEQEHVRAFRTYNGTTRRPFDLTLCRSEFDSAIQQMFEAEASARRSAAQAASDALDPFHFDVDLDCEDNPDAGRGSQKSSGGAQDADENK